MTTIKEGNKTERKKLTLKLKPAGESTDVSAVKSQTTKKGSVEVTIKGRKSQPKAAPSPIDKANELEIKRKLDLLNNSSSNDSSDVNKKISQTIKNEAEKNKKDNTVTEKEEEVPKEKVTVDEKEINKNQELEDKKRIQQKIANLSKSSSVDDHDVMNKIKNSLAISSKEEKEKKKVTDERKKKRAEEERQNLIKKELIRAQEEEKKSNNKSSFSQRKGKRKLTYIIDDDDNSFGNKYRGKKRKQQAVQKNPEEQKEYKKISHEVLLPELITVSDLSERMSEKTGDVVKKLFTMGVVATSNQSIDADTAELIIEEFGHKIKRVTDADVEIGLGGDEDADGDLISRPPVVTIMGHVDHGKTSLLDALRQTDVVAGEAGGITQHIGAYQVNMQSGDKITFLDTPGHAAFTEMRARGADVTDIVVIVVAADDSIMPQTIEAISHAKAAEVPIIIAINKIDLPAADPAKVKTQLLQHDIVVEDLSGDVQCVEISAKKKTNLDKLEEAILLQSEILELKANPDREAQGFVVESKLEKGRGSVATVLIQKGTLRIGDVFVAGAEVGKVRALINDHGVNVDHAIPGQPVEVLGLNASPDAGDQLSVVNDEAKAREISEYRQKKRKKEMAIKAVKGRTTIEQLLAQKEAGEITSLPMIIKGDVHGSVEALVGSLDKMVEDNEGIAVHMLHTGVGGITESDVTLAGASNGLIIGFNVRANAQARELAQKNGVDIRYYNVIYNAIDDAKSILTGMLAPDEREQYLGNAEIKEVFNITKVGKVAGCIITMGMVKRGSKVRLLRDDVVIHEGMLKTLKRHKDEVKEVKEGVECGMAFETYDDIKEGDVIECFEIIEEARVLT